MSRAQPLRGLVRSPPDADPPTRTGPLGRFRWWARTAGRLSYRRLRAYLILAVQAGLAAAIAWVVAHELLGNPEPVFAPTAAVGTIVASIGARLRRTIDLILGIALGVAVGDGLLAVAGTGPWQTGLTVTLAVAGAIGLTGSGVLTAQAGSTGVLIAALSPQVRDLEVPRFVDATVGGAAGLLVVLLLLPISPLRTIARLAEPTLDLLARELDVAAEALSARDAECAQRSLDRLRRVDPDLLKIREAVQGAREVVRLAPARLHRRASLELTAHAVEHLERALRNSRALVRRVRTLIRDGEPVPPALPAALHAFAAAVRSARTELRHEREPGRPRERTLAAVHAAGRAYRAGLGFSGNVVVGQLRTAASDLLRATGLSRSEANRMVRHAMGRTSPPAAPSGRPAR